MDNQRLYIEHELIFAAINGARDAGNRRISDRPTGETVAQVQAAEKQIIDALLALANKRLGTLE